MIFDELVGAGAEVIIWRIGREMANIRTVHVLRVYILLT